MCYLNADSRRESLRFAPLSGISAVSSPRADTVTWQYGFCWLCNAADKETNAGMGRVRLCGLDVAPGDPFVLVQLLFSVGQSNAHTC